MKFVHILGAMGLAGGLAAYMITLWVTPGNATAVEYAALRTSLASVTSWLIVPSMMIAVVSGLIALIVHPQFMDAPWVWIKALTGLLFFEATLASIDAPADQAALAMAEAVAGDIDTTTLAKLVRNEWSAWWMLLSLSIANVALGVWRPRFGKRSES